MSKKLFKLYKPCRFNYLEPIWQENEFDSTFSHTMVSKRVTISPIRLTCKADAKNFAIMRLASTFSLPPILFDGIDNEFAIVSREGCQSHITTLDDIDNVFRNPYPGNTHDYQPIYFDKHPCGECFKQKRMKECTKTHPYITEKIEKWLSK
jgi:hypothetical protein